MLLKYRWPVKFPTIPKSLIKKKGPQTAFPLTVEVLILTNVSNGTIRFLHILTAVYAIVSCIHNYWMYSWLRYYCSWQCALRRVRNPRWSSTERQSGCDSLLNPSSQGTSHMHQYTRLLRPSWHVVSQLPNSALYQIAAFSTNHSATRLFLPLWDACLDDKDSSSWLFSKQTNTSHSSLTVSFGTICTKESQYLVTYPLISTTAERRLGIMMFRFQKIILIHHISQTMQNKLL